MKKLLFIALLIACPLIAHNTEFEKIENGRSLLKIFDNSKPIKIISETDGKAIQIFLERFPHSTKVEFLRIVPLQDPSPNYDADCRVELRWTTSTREERGNEWIRTTETSTQHFPIKIKTVKKLSSRKGKVLYNKDNLRVIRVR